MSNEQSDVIVLTDEDGNDVNFEILDVYELNGTEYFALIEADDDEADEVLILKVVADKNGEDMLEIIEDEQELQLAFDEFVSRIGEDE